jgi:hypothetical protein
MTFLPPISRILFTLAGALGVALAPLASAIDAGDMDPHLPDAVVLATMRFQAFTRKAENREEWEAKHAELLALLSASLEEASQSDIRAATALRTLISDLREAEYVPQKKTKKPDSEYPVLPDGNRVMVKDDFHINKPEERVLTYPFEVKRVPAMIKIGIGGGSDDSGDGGLHYLLIDPVGRVIKRGFSTTDEFVWEQHQSTRSGTWKLILEDLDTDMRAKNGPGNRGTVEVLVKAE